MRGGIILSNRLRAMQEAADNFGESIGGIKEAQRKARLEAEDRTAAAKSQGLRDTAAQQGIDQNNFALADIKRRDTARQEAEGFAGELASFGQAVPESTIEAPEGLLPGFQPEQSMRPVSDTTSKSLLNRIKASWRNADARAKGESAAYTAADIEREDAQSIEKKKRADEEFSLGIDKTKADIESTKATTGSKLMEAKKTALELKKLQAEIDQIGKGGMDPEKAIIAEGKLRDSYLGQTKGFTDVHDAYGRVMASVKDPSPAGDIALIFNYMKMLDPGSTVREGEFATAESAGSIPTTVLNKYNKAISGERLGETRADFIKQAGNLYQTAHKNYERNRKTFSDLATSYKLDPSRVAIPLETAGVAPAPAAGGVDKRALAQQALNDPEATPAEKAAAQKILGKTPGAQGKF
jgi:hypothetical protein